jgi:hypothetical protein
MVKEIKDTIDKELKETRKTSHKSYLQIQCNPYQNPDGFFFFLQAHGIPSQDNLEKEN